MTMQYTQLGRTGLKVSRYCLGFISWSPLAGGLLGGGVSKGKGDRRQWENKHLIARFPGALEKYEKLCKKWGYAPADVALKPDMMKKLDELFPGPGGTAPECYAW